MTYEVYRSIFIGTGILAGMMFLVSVLLFFFLRIPKVIGELTGVTARKGVRNIRARTVQAGGDLSVTEKIEKPQMAENVLAAGAKETELLPRGGENLIQGMAEETELLPRVKEGLTQWTAEGTEVLSDREESLEFYIVEEITYVQSRERIP